MNMNIRQKPILGFRNYNQTKILAVLFLLLSLTPSGTTQPVNEPLIYAVGDYAQGGVVFYVDASGQHGKVVYMHQMGFIRWSEVSSTYNYSRSWSPTNGAGNTSAIIQNPNHLISAASLCAEMAYGGYDDWYLPSTEELSDLYDVRTVVDQKLSEIGGEPLGTNAYWSSLESNSNFEMAYAWKFFDGTPALGSKNGFSNTRAVRAF